MPVRPVRICSLLTVSANCMSACTQVIRIPGYIADEKVHIARQYLEPQTQRDAGIPATAASITDNAMHTLIDEYARRVSQF